MNLRTLLLAVAAAASSCAIEVPQFKCPTPGESIGCGSNQICGPDRFCTTRVECKVNVEASCGGSCVDITHNRENCGACGTVCGPSQQCVSGKCTDFCATGQAACQQSTGGFICQNLSNDRTNCGTCGNVCPQGKVCSPPTTGAPGQCATECVPGLTNCSGNCLDLNSDDAACGACGSACGSGTHCVSGHCSVICTPGTTECPAGSGKCVDLTTDRANCGGCAGGGGQVCLAGFVCTASSCQLSCQSGRVNCGGNCINPQSDRKFCGAKLDCAGANAGTACADGQVCTNNGPGNTGICELSCPAGETPIGFPVWNSSTPYYVGNEVTNAGNLYRAIAAGTSTASGAPTGTGASIADGALVWKFVSAAPAGNSQCVNLQTDRNNCGAPDDAGNTRACAGGQVCQGGACVVSCPAGLAFCNGACVDTHNDPAHCGDCVTSCSAAGSPGPVCGNGTCGVSCPLGEATCAGKCVDTSTDSKHCGADLSCNGGTDCSAIGQVCSNNGCVLRCPTGSVACNGKCIDPLTDNANCGASGASCTGGVNCAATGKVCVSGACDSVCSSPLSKCAAGAASYCANKQSDLNNCGTCNNVCTAPATATPYCASGNCGATCTGTFAHCTTIATDVCETDLSLTATHCGSCTNACARADNAAPVCANSTCGTSCQTGFADCDGDPLNGCESNKTHDAANCNSCGSICSGTTPYCASGCVAFAGAAGVQENLPATDIAGDWGTPCFSETYSHVGTSLAAIQTACPSGTQVLIACQAPGASTLLVAGMALRSAVFSGGGTDPVFYVPGTSVPAFGFAPAGVSSVFTVSGTGYAFDVGASAIDGFAGAFGSQRISWPVSGGVLTAGGRCGDRTGSSATSNYLRLVYTK